MASLSLGAEGPGGKSIAVPTSLPLITLASAPKPILRAADDPQWKAIQSWKRLEADCEVILIGDEPGISNTSHVLGTRHIPHVQRNEHGTPVLNDIFRLAERHARGRFVCYVNTDIMLTSDFVSAVRSLAVDRFVMVGQRTNIDPTFLPDPSFEDWEHLVRGAVARHGHLAGPALADYFVFPPGVFKAIPPFALGRTMWDGWLMYAARTAKLPLIDATSRVLAIHQNHDYSHHSAGATGVWKGPEAEQNRVLAGGIDYSFSIADSNWVLTSKGLSRPPALLRAQRFIDTGPALHPRFARAFRVTGAAVRLKRETGNRAKSLVPRVIAKYGGGRREAE